MSHQREGESARSRPVVGRDAGPGRANYRRARQRRGFPWLRALAAALVVVVASGALWLVLGIRQPPHANVAPTPGPLPTVEPEPREHRWLGRPIARTAQRDFADRTYLFGASKNNAYRVHHGMDLVNPTGTPVQAAADGVVVFAGRDAGTRFGPKTIPDFYGNLVLIKLAPSTYHGQDVYNLYGHLDSIAVRDGQTVKQGDLLGKVGMTGTADGPHLHFEVRVGGTTYSDSRNPALWLHSLPGTGSLAGKVLDRTGKPVNGATVTLMRDISASDTQKYWGEVSSYPVDPLGKLNADDDWQENFAVVDLPVGEYDVRAILGGQTYVRNVIVQDGRTTWVDIKEGGPTE
jgi:murein DD-endopeptidase MepM/ murein hydrolase activator NlpD